MPVESSNPKGSVLTRGLPLLRPTIPAAGRDESVPPVDSQFMARAASRNPRVRAQVTMLRQSAGSG